MPMDYRSQIDLPVAASHEKSPVRKQELDQHGSSELHIQNDGLTGQLLVMTSMGPRMMFPKLNCKCGSHYGCDCRIVFDDDPTLLSTDDRDVVQIAVGQDHTYFRLRNGEVHSAGRNDQGQLGRAVASGSFDQPNCGQIILPTGVGNTYPFMGVASTLNTGFFTTWQNVHGEHYSNTYACGSNEYNLIGTTGVTTGSPTTMNLKQTGPSQILWRRVHEVHCGDRFVLYFGRISPPSVPSVQFLESVGGSGYGQLGTYSGDPGSVEFPQSVYTDNAIKRLAVGGEFVHAQIGDNQIWSWGRNDRGQCGLRAGSMPFTPTRSCTASQPLFHLSAGSRHGFHYIVDSATPDIPLGGYLFGAGGSDYPSVNPDGLNGDGTWRDITASPFSIHRDYEKILASNEASFFIRNNIAYGCGNNSVGQVMPGSTAPTILYQQSQWPGNPALLANCVDVASNGKTTFWILGDGRVAAHGDNTSGQMGVATATATRTWGIVDFHS